MLSVIIPAYNASATLARALASCLSQAEVSQVVVVDDASQDDTWQLAQAWAQEYPLIQVLQQPCNQGAAAARNRGLQASQNDWLAFLDADDCYLPNAFSVACKALAQHAHLAAIKLPCALVDGPPDLQTHRLYEEACAVLVNTFAGNLVIRKPVLTVMGGFPTDPVFREQGGEDGALMLALSNFFTVGRLIQDPPCVQVSIRAPSHSLRFFDHFFQQYANTAVGEGPLPDGEVWRQTRHYVAQVGERLAQAQWPSYPGEKGLVPIWSNAG